MIGKRKNIDRESNTRTFEGAKTYCSWLECANPNADKDMIICTKCLRSYHCDCCDPPLIQLIIQRFPWMCNECKVCVDCSSSQNEN